MTKIYPRTGDKQTVYLNTIIQDPQIVVGDYTIYNDFVNDPCYSKRIMSFIIIPAIRRG